MTELPEHRVPRVEIKKVGRWTYDLVLYPAGTWMGFEGGRVLGQARAERRARRLLRRELRRKSETVAVIT